MKYCLLAIIFVQIQCASFKVYELAFPTSVNSASKSNIDSVKLLENNSIELKVKTLLSTSPKCIELIQTSQYYSVYSYSFKNCSLSDARKDLEQEKNTNPAILPILDQRKTDINLSEYDAYSKYSDYLPYVQEYLNEIQTKKVYINNKKDKIYLTSGGKYCIILNRDARYPSVSNYKENPGNCPASYPQSDFKEINVFQAETAKLYLDFHDGRLVYTLPKSNLRSIYLNIVELNRDDNYFYLLLMPTALVFDIVTFPFQLVYFWALGNAIPAH
ncbi:MAG TPA: hypothetical protein PK079_22080 [Leptospiraceae bacterium]|nr:hypothetical protein [Leptospiraceae bacterium]HMX33111.1 hypothetical protein [Leptospiraceae bacterium]HMY33109.1 hypothetical protein [Leptospiraceae bacterium]HMZ64234.1 hypothetical protein [Leptospiraceae bacterium]HNA09825.1 hypothetical protein [Leptospiraceae bacterium]